MSSATLRALMEAPSNPRLVNPTAYSPFVPFQPSGKAILGKPSSSLKKSSSLQEPRTMLGNKMSPKSTNGLTEGLTREGEGYGKPHLYFDAKYESRVQTCQQFIEYWSLSWKSNSGYWWMGWRFVLQKPHILINGQRAIEYMKTGLELNSYIDRWCFVMKIQWWFNVSETSPTPYLHGVLYFPPTPLPLWGSSDGSLYWCLGSFPT